MTSTIANAPKSTAPKTSPESVNAPAWIVALIAAIVASILILRIPSPAQPWLSALRPDREVVAIGAAGRVARGSAARNPGAATHEGALFSIARPGHFSALRDLDFRHARQLSRQDRLVGRGLRTSADRLDHPQCHLHVSAHLRGWTVQGVAREPDGHHARPALAAPADRVQLWRVL
jgi:hypothetical protein